MAGHSKWANIKHQKARSDAKKGKAFTRAAKEIITAVKLGGPDPKSNTRLRLALQNARAANVPNDNIERSIKKGSSQDVEAYHDVQYELYGHGGVGLIVEVLTDNKNRASSEIRIATNKRGGSIATPGSVAFNFERKGVITVAKNKAFEDELFVKATESGAEDFIAEDDTYIIITDPQELYNIKEKLSHRSVECEESTLEMIPKTYVDCDVETAKQNLALIEWLDGIDDVDAVFHNMKIPDELS